MSAEPPESDEPRPRVPRSGPEEPVDAFDAVWGRPPGAGAPGPPAAGTPAPPAGRPDPLEGSGAEHKRRSQQEAKTIRDEAYADARRIRSNTYQAVREDIATASETSRAFVERFGQAMTELRELVDTMRACADKLAADLATVQDDERATPPASSPVDLVPQRATARVADAASASSGPSADVPRSVPTPSDPPVPPATGGRSEWDRARLLALNMALNGASRDEADRYLAENLHLEGRGALLDEVFAPSGRGGGEEAARR